MTTRIKFLPTTTCYKTVQGNEEVELLEALYQVYRGKAILEYEGRELNLEEAIKLIANKCSRNIWVEFEVYIDLRKRGRILSIGPKPNTLLMKKSKSKQYYEYYILILEENKPIPLRILKDFIEEARKNSWKPIIAVVDRYGDITYYMPTPFTP